LVLLATRLAVAIAVAGDAVGSYPAISPLPWRPALHADRLAESLRIPRLDRRYRGFPRRHRPSKAVCFCCALCRGAGVPSLRPACRPAPGCYPALRP